MTTFDITVLSLNLRFGRAQDGPNGWSFRKQLIPRLLRSFPADFYAFQEVNDFQAEDLKAILPGYGVIGLRKTAPKYWQNNLIFYLRDWQCQEDRHFYLSDTPDCPSQFAESKWPRQGTIGLFRRSHRRLICINTHFDFSATAQEKSARVILTKLSRFPNEIPAILMGDFNATPADSCYRIFTEKAKCRCKDVADVSVAPRFRAVFSPPYPSSYHGFSGHAQGGLIDWVLYRGEIEPQKTEIIRKSIDGRYPSDHFPLFVAFNWR